ncbi:unnamed protein product, partial [Hydatigera taeniaeformis]|uniref:Si:ch73-389k6.1 n=1 Tax=Hydatigena taeniaeformis TaxID=6205 RepID=A0A0R3WYB9_HYDTA
IREPASTQSDVSGAQSPNKSYSEVGGNSEPIFGLIEHCHLDKPKKTVTLSDLLIQAKGPDRSLLCRRILARGPDLSLHRGPNSSLANGPNPALLRKNRS